MIESAATEQDCAFRTAGRERWKPTDFDGLMLLARPRDPHEPWRPSEKEADENRPKS
ncbi:type I-E CRISPR-associated endoribonuclease Cas2 [Haloglycomyces albus]|uniref:type I-E CRISPR-associated endoribonuclease Cas2 n=1 Tax=Haloglycomyces albus TaxID=526067 RepID=UPI00316AD189